MFLPENYPKQLSSILDSYGAHGLIPDYSAVHFFDLKDDFEALFKDHSVKFKANKRVLDIGGRSIAYLYNSKKFVVESYEPREAFQKLGSELHGDNVRYLHDLKDLDFNQYDCVLINIELLGLEGIDLNLTTLNEHFSAGLKVFAYRLRPRHKEISQVYHLGDGSVCDESLMLKRFKMLNSHIHMGLKKYEYPYMDVFGLCRDY